MLRTLKRLKIFEGKMERSKFKIKKKISRAAIGKKIYKLVFFRASFIIQVLFLFVFVFVSNSL